MNFKSLYDSTVSFHQRFDVNPPTTQQAFRVLQEEMGEFIQAWQDHDVENASLEAIDAIVTIIGCLRSIGCDYNDILWAMGMVIDKNNAKTTETHFLNDDGKITRIEQQMPLFDDISEKK